MQIEYKCVPSFQCQGEYDFNSLGRDGWEFCGAVRDGNEFLFKREYVEPKKVQRKPVSRESRAEFVRGFLDTRTEPITPEQLIDVMKGVGLFAPTTYWKDVSKGVVEMAKEAGASVQGAWREEIITPKNRV